VGVTVPTICTAPKLLKIADDEYLKHSLKNTPKVVLAEMLFNLPLLKQLVFG
jgi:hypothetical protein